jgi:hypothetical protein
MSDNLMSRRKFLAGAGLVLGAASVSGVALLKDADPAAAAAPAIPWYYPSTPADQPAPEAVARRAYEIYFRSGCAEAAWGSCIEALAAVPGAQAEQWASLPANLFRFGGGGIAGWGTICGTLNGAAAFISMAVGQNLADDGVTKVWTHRNNLINGVFQYYNETPLPTNNAYKSAQGVFQGLGSWTPAAPAVAPIKNAPSSTANSPLCHSSLVQWTETTGNRDQSPAQRDRCGKACFDVARVTIEMLNTYFELKSAPSVPLDPSVAACGTCHKEYTGAKMACGSCHDNTLTDGHMGL